MDRDDGIDGNGRDEQMADRALSSIIELVRGDRLLFCAPGASRPEI
jgi:hypothetical protein